MKHIILGLTLLTGFTAFGQCEALKADMVGARNEYLRYMGSDEELNDRLSNQFQKAKAAYKDCVAGYNRPVSYYEHRAKTRFERLSLKAKVQNVKYHKRLGVLLTFTPAAPVGGFLLLQANLRQDKINEELIK